MFNRLPELLGKKFLIGYFVPSLLLVIGSVCVGKLSGLVSEIDLLQLVTGSDLLSLSLVSFFISLIFLVSNREIIRIMEGYGRLNPVRLLSFVEKWRYSRLKKLRSTLHRERRLLSKKNSYIRDQKLLLALALRQPEIMALFDLFTANSLQEVDLKRAKVMRELSHCFPRDETLLLPNSFGNVIRAFEEYPYVMYGIDAVVSWGRLNGVIPEDYRTLIDDAQANVDFWANLTAASFVILLENVGIAFVTNTPGSLIYAAIPAIGMYISYLGAKSSALQWGDVIKSAFDLFLPDLQKKLGFPEFSSDNEARDTWTRFSQSILYMNPRIMPERHTPKPENIDPDSQKILIP